MNEMQLITGLIIYFIIIGIIYLYYEIYKIKKTLEEKSK
jgi:hypothetical protein